MRGHEYKIMETDGGRGGWRSYREVGVGREEERERKRDRKGMRRRDS